MQKPYIQTFSNKKIGIFALLTFVFVIFAFIIGVIAGAVSITIPDIFRILSDRLFHTSSYIGDKGTELIIWEIRLSRVVLAFIIGAALSLAGAAFQGLLRNTLADPYTIGVSSGASLGAVLVIFFHFSIGFLGDFTQPIVAIIFALLTLLIVLLITNFATGKYSNETIILAGIIISSFISANISLVIALSSREDLSNIVYWLMGSVAMRGWGHVQLVLPFFIIGAVIILAHYRELNAMALGEEAAQFSGMNVKRKKKIILVGAAILAGAAVAVSGAIGFVGLVIPHLVRLITGANHRYVLPFSLFVGGAYLVIADVISRTIIAPSELPIGIVTALIGSPVFAILLIKQRLNRKSV